MIYVRGWGVALLLVSLILAGCASAVPAASPTSTNINAAPTAAPKQQNPLPGPRLIAFFSPR